MKPLIPLLFATFALSACLSAQRGELSHAIPVSDKFAEGKVEWDEGLGDYTYLWGVTELNGEILICGVGKYSSSRAVRDTEDVMRRARAELRGKPILVDLTFFGVVDADANLRRQVAKCSRTGTPVPEGGWNVTLDGPAGIFGSRDE